MTSAPPDDDGRATSLLAIFAVLVSTALASAVLCLWMLDLSLPFGCPSPWPFNLLGFRLLQAAAVIMLVVAVIAARAARNAGGAILAAIVGLIIPWPPVTNGRNQILYASLLSSKCAGGDVYACEWAGTFYHRLGDEPRAHEEHLKGCLAGRMTLCEWVFQDAVPGVEKACPAVIASCAREPTVLDGPSTACQIKAAYCAGATPR
ncbi:MAG: hypothetical protein QM820_15205 [Minicystis sp.]